MKNIIWLLWISTLISGCMRILNCKEKEKYTFSKTNYLGKEIKTNGYYFSSKYYPLIFYRNGVMIRDILDTNDYNLTTFESWLLNGRYGTGFKNSIYNWCLFKIKDNQVKYEGFSAKSGISCKYTYIRTGSILNDSTILFTNQINSDGTESESQNDTFHFKQFSPKPDSINSFIN